MVLIASAFLALVTTIAGDLAVPAVALGEGRRTALIPVYLAVPAIHAAVLATALPSPMADIDAGAVIRINLRNGFWAGGLSACVTTMSMVPVAGAIAGNTVLAAARNGAGLFGLSLIATVLIAARHVWTVPIGALGLLLVGGFSDRSHPNWWAWPLQPPEHLGSFIAAAALLGTGILAFSTNRVDRAST